VAVVCPAGDDKDPPAERDVVDEECALRLRGGVDVSGRAGGGEHALGLELGLHAARALCARVGQEDEGHPVVLHAGRGAAVGSEAAARAGGDEGGGGLGGGGLGGDEEEVEVMMGRLVGGAITLRYR